MISNSIIQNPFKKKLRLLIRYFFLSLLIKIAATIIIIISESLIFNGPIPLFQNQLYLTDKYELYFSISLLVLIFPVLEEFAFRGWFSENKFLTSISLTILLFYFLYVMLIIALPKVIPLERIYRFSLLYAVLPFGFYFFHRNFLKIRRVIELKHTWLIIFSIISFSCIHSFNYKIADFNEKSILALIIILLPYPFSAYLYIHVRIKNGLAWSIALHILDNSIVLIPALLLGKKI